MNDITSIFKNFKGDKALWGFVIVVSLFSILPVYSGSANLEYVQGQGTTTYYIIKHLGLIFVGVLVMIGVQLLRYKYLAKICSILLWLIIIALAFVAFFGSTIVDGASASRQITIPGSGMGFQPSAFAYVFLSTHLCRLLVNDAPNKEKSWKFLFSLFAPVILVFILIAKDNGSTAVMVLMVSIIVMVIGQLGWKYILSFIAISGAAIGIFLLVLLNTNLVKDHRLDTWKGRIERHFSDDSDKIKNDADKDKDRQIELVTAALVNGGFSGIGPGKSAIKQDLSQSTSDFVFAIIVEEYGVLGAAFLLFCYTIIFVRILTIASRFPDFFGSLLVICMGVILFVQIFFHIGVSLRMLPVTGQPLPLVSYGGTAMLSTYLLFGLILNVSASIQLNTEEGYSAKEAIQEISDIA